MSGDAFWQDTRDEIAADPEYAQMHATEEQRVSLTHFLLARIAEDATGEHDYWCSWSQASEACDCPRKLIAAECEAKRRIVEVLEHDYRWASGPLLESASMVLEIMARPYADHPHYRREWSV